MTIIRPVGGWNAAKELAGPETATSTGVRVALNPESVDIPDDEWAAMPVGQRHHYRHQDDVYTGSHAVEPITRLRLS